MSRIKGLLQLFVALLCVAFAAAEWDRIRGSARIQSFPKEFQQQPPESPSYMVDNTGNKRGVAPINGEYNGPVWHESGSFENYMKKLRERKARGELRNATSPISNGTLLARQSGGFWLTTLGPLGKAPYAGDDYIFYRDVVKDYGADNTGATNTEEAINAAIIDGDRCGEECGNTFVKGAVIYFPPGTYKVCTPIIQYYLTQFVGDPHDRPIIKGCDEFTGIAMVDVDPYVPNMAQPDGTGVNWYINQNQFFRGIRNIVFDLTEMPAATDEHGQELVPTGIHWQVSQACSLHNLYFKMPTASTTSEKLTHVGIFTENGSGGFVSDLEFEGGAIGWRVGSQQYTATNLKFNNCVTAVQMVWDWGFNWHKIEVNGGTIAFNISGRGGIDGQGIGSVSIIDSSITGVPIGILTNGHETQAPNIVIDNTAFDNVGTFVQVDSGETLLSGGSQLVDLWAHGRRYGGGDGKFVSGAVEGRPRKPMVLLDDGGNLFTRARPQYEDLPASSFLIATEHGCTNDATGDNTEAINAFLRQAANSGQVAYFPGGIYTIRGTVTFPTGSKVMGTGWSQIQATGSYFQDMENPKVAVRVGEEGDVGTMEIVDMLFTVRGNTAGAIMMEWNIHESSQGSAALWDSHIRIGGGIGTDLDIATCPKFGYNEACICASLLLHVTSKASGYFENFWAWVADHDNDMSLYWEVDSSASQISLYSARGVLIESEGPVWMYGSGSEHVIYYQYQTYKAKNVYLGHIQTESPYFQPNPVSPKPFDSALGLFPSDPDWSDCTTDRCREAWGLRILDSEDVIVHSAGLYSWFVDYGQDCLATEDCQEKIMQVKGSKGVAIYNIFAKGVEEIASGDGYTIQQDDNQRGYTSQVSVWFPNDVDSSKNIVYLGTELYQTPTAACHSPCILVLAPSPLATTTTITIEPYTTSLQVGQTTTTVTVTPKPVTTDKVPFSNVNITRGVTSGAVFETKTSLVLEDITVTLTYVSGGVTTTSQRELQLPPWPQITDGPPENWNSSDGDWVSTGATGTATGVSSSRLLFTSLEPWPLDSTTTTSEVPAATPTSFPIIFLIPLFDDIDPQCTSDGCPAEEDDGESIKVKVSCNELWFFNFCIEVEGLRVTGWTFKLPKGRIGPGPPPFAPKLPKWYINFPPPIPPWPLITVGPGGISFPEKDPSCDDNKVSVPVEIYTKSYGLSVSNGVTVTTTTRTITETAYDTGCPTPEWTQTAACSMPSKRAAAVTPSPTRPSAPLARRHGSSGTTPFDSRLRVRDVEEWQHDWDCPGGKADTIIYLEDDADEDDAREIYARLEYDKDNFGQNFEVFQHENPSIWVLFFYIWQMPKSLREKVALMPGIGSLTHLVVPKIDGPKVKGTLDEESLTQRGGFVTKDITNGTSKIHSRELTRHRDAWWRSQISSYPGQAWEYEGEDTDDDFLLKYNYYHDTKLGDGQFVYIFEEGLTASDPEFDGQDIEFLPGRQDIGPKTPARIDHGTTSAKLVAGKNLGLVPNAKIITFRDTPFFTEGAPWELVLIGLLQIIEHAEQIEDQPFPIGQGKCVINMSWGINVNGREFLGREMLKLLKYLENVLQCVLVAAAGNLENQGANIDYPNIFRYDGDLMNLFVVGATGKEAHRAYFSSTWKDENGEEEGDDAIMYAPGLRMEIPGSSGRSIKLTSGTSLAAPQLTGVVAYLRALDSKWAEDLQNPENVYKMVNYLARKINVVREVESDTPGLLDPSEIQDDQPSIPWNGQVEHENCLLEYVSPLAKRICDEYVKDIPDDLNNWEPERMPDACERSGVSERRIKGRALICEAGGNSGSGRGGGFTWVEGAPSPTCATGCGTLCRGYYCVPNPTGAPPDFGDATTITIPNTTRAPVVTSTGRGPITTTGDGDGAPTDFPALTGTVPYSGEGCSTYTTSTICNGSGGRAACATYNLCVPTKPCPPAYTVPSTPRCTDSEFPYCAITTIVTRCARPLPTDDAVLPRDVPLVPASVVTLTTGPASGFITLPSPSLGSKTRRPYEEDDLSPAVAPSDFSPGSLQSRQNGCGGSANGGCDYIPFCQTCAKIVQVPCLEAKMDIYAGGASGIDVTMTVWEDGTKACEGKFNCKYWSLNQCNDVKRFTCGGGGSMAVRFNFISYVSGRDGETYPIWIDVSEPNHDYKLEFCWQTVGPRTLPSACYHTEYSYKNGLCDAKGLKRDLPELPMNATIAL